MSRLKHYNSFRLHGHLFNLLFSTSIAVAVSLFLGELLNQWFIFRDYNGSLSGFWLLIIIPIIVFAAEAANSEVRLAYFRTWHDLLRSRLDQKKILRQFAKQYNISNWRIRVNHIDTDGRWNFRAETPYAEHLANQRDLLLNQIYQDYLDNLNLLNIEVVECERTLGDAKNSLETAEKLQHNTEKLLASAKTDGEIYVQRQKYNRLLTKVHACQEIVNHKEHDLKLAEDAKNALVADLREVNYRITKIFESRYEKYTERVVKKINRINRLKYHLAGMPKVAAWTTSPNSQKELV